jgi:mRNA-degrading endonuclease YafQ of YafQ-DinJ toxin-antitoxin module
MISLEYASDFIRKYDKLESDFQSEIDEKLEDLRDIDKHRKLKVHKLKGLLRGYYAFSVNYKDRIIFEWNKKKGIIYLIDVGDHSIYK